MAFHVRSTACSGFRGVLPGRFRLAFSPTWTAGGLGTVMGQSACARVARMCPCVRAPGSFQGLVWLSGSPSCSSLRLSLRSQWGVSRSWGRSPYLPDVGVRPVLLGREVCLFTFRSGKHRGESRLVRFERTRHRLQSGLRVRAFLPRF